MNAARDRRLGDTPLAEDDLVQDLFAIDGVRERLANLDLSGGRAIEIVGHGHDAIAAAGFSRRPSQSDAARRPQTLDVGTGHVADVIHLTPD